MPRFAPALTGGARRLAAPLSALAVATAALLPVGALVTPTPAVAQTADDPVRAARDAFARKDRVRLAALRAQVLDARHPLAPWVDYWELNVRLGEARVEDVEAFYQRWPGSYVEDRLRNDWLLELGKRRDWAAFSRDLPRFRMNDDREVHCYAQVAAQLEGKGNP